MDLTLQAAVRLTAELHEATTARAAERAPEGRDAELRAELRSAEERAEELLDEVTWLVDDDDDGDGDSEHCSHF